MSLLGLAGRVCSCVLYVCCCSSLTGNLPNAVWPAGLLLCMCVVALPWLENLPSVVWPAGFAAVYVCCGSSLTGDLPSAVWLAGFAAVYVYCGSFRTGDLLKYYNYIVSLSCSCRLSRSIFSGNHTMATGEHCLVISVDLFSET